MTMLHSGAALVRETSIEYKGRKLIVECHPAFAVMRRKGLQKESYMITWDAVFEAAGKIEAMRKKETTR